MLAPHEDAYGHAIWDFFNGKTAYEIVERDDGYIDVSSGPMRYLSTYPEWPEQERQAMDLVRGRVLDLGCGAGRHLLYLQERGHDATGIDISPMAIRTCRKRGAAKARVLSVTQLSPRLGRFDTITMMCNNCGLLGNAKRGPWLLRRLAAMTGPEGRILADSTDPGASKNTCHQRYLKTNKARGRMPGQLRVRVRYQTYRTPWFDYLLASPAELARLCQGTPWQITETIGPNSMGHYVALLEKAIPNPKR